MTTTEILEGLYAFAADQYPEHTKQSLEMEGEGLFKGPVTGIEYLGVGGSGKKLAFVGETISGAPALRIDGMLLVSPNAEELKSFLGKEL